MEYAYFFVFEACFGFDTCGIYACAMDGVKQKRNKSTRDREYRQLSRRHDHFLKRYDEIQGQMQFHRNHAYHLEAELRTLRPEVYRAQQENHRLRERIEAQAAKIDALKKQLDAVKETLDLRPKQIPDFVKTNVPQMGKKRPGRKVGHEVAHRPLPPTIDLHVNLPLPKDAGGVCSCPHCNTQLNDVKQHDRIVEDIAPAKPVVSCYNTASGYCPSCRKRIETRAPEQPPAADVPHGQLGLNALAMAAVMRAVYRMPFELISQLMADLPGITISKGGIAKQMQRMGGWLEKEYERIRLLLHFSPAVHMDETSWRVDGKNWWLWVMLDDRHTLFHVDKSRGGQVVLKLLGEVFSGILVTDFYIAYNLVTCPKQKCLVHLLREIRDTAAKNPAFGTSSFARRLKRLIKELLLLKKQKPKMKADEYQRKGRRLEERLEELSQQNESDADINRLCKRLRKHKRELTLFLWEEVDASNNAAERALRPAVVMRKISGGSRSERGAKATAILMSVMRTARQQNLPVFETFKKLLMAAWANQPPGLLTNTPTNTS